MIYCIYYNTYYTYQFISVTVCISVYRNLIHVMHQLYPVIACHDPNISQSCLPICRPVRKWFEVPRWLVQQPDQREDPSPRLWSRRDPRMPSSPGIGHQLPESVGWISQSFWVQNMRRLQQTHIKNIKMPNGYGPKNGPKVCLNLFWIHSGTIEALIQEGIKLVEDSKISSLAKNLWKVCHIGSRLAPKMEIWWNMMAYDEVWWNMNICGAVS